jgi:hypothetical protein
VNAAPIIRGDKTVESGILTPGFRALFDIVGLNRTRPILETGEDIDFPARTAGSFAVL